jgi:hypothetical protein
MLKLYGDFVDGECVSQPDVILCGAEPQEEEPQIEELFVDHGGEG